MRAASPQGDLVDHTTAAAIEEKKKLQKHFKRFDILFFLLCTLIGLDTVGAVASEGAEAFTWLMVLAVVFFLPYAMTMAELGTAFPEEGGPYVWTRLAFGRLVAAVNAFFYWVSNPIWVGGTLTVAGMVAIDAFFLNRPMHGFWQYVFGLAFIWFTVVAAIISFKTGKWIPTVGAFVRIGLLLFFALSVILFAAQHGVHGFGGHAFLPTWAVFISVAPLLFFNYTGFEVPSAAGEEMTNPRRDVPFAITWSAIGTIVLYGGPILLILVVLPSGQVSNYGGFLDAMKAVFTVYGGHIAADGTVTLTGAGKVLGDIGAIGFIIAIATIGTTWIMGADRAQAAAGFDGAGPRSLGYFSPRFGTPVVVNVLTGVVATALMVMVLTITGGNVAKYFTVVLGLVLSTTVLSYIGIFPAVIKLRYSHPHVPRPFRVPGGTIGVWLVGGLTTFWAVFCSAVLIWPGLGANWFGHTGNPDDSLASGFTRAQFELTQLVPLGILLAIGVIFFVLGKKTREEAVDIPFAEEVPAAELSSQTA